MWPKSSPHPPNPSPFPLLLIPHVLQVAKKCGPGLRESILQQLALLTSIVHQNIAPFLPTLFEIVHDYWNEHLGHILILVLLILP